MLIPEEVVSELFATNTTAGPESLERLAEILHIAGLLAAAWVCEDAIRAHDHEIIIAEMREDERVKADEAQTATQQARIEELEKEADSLCDRIERARQMIEAATRVSDRDEILAALEGK